MARYIDAELLKEKFAKRLNNRYGIVIKIDDVAVDLGLAICDTPTADVVEVKHGHWVKHSPDVAAMRAFHKLGIGKGMNENSIFWTCSCCDSWGSLTQKYCNQCGAKMDGGIICKT